VVHAQFGRSQNKNKETALKILKARLLELGNIEQRDRRNKKRREQVGRGLRGEKVRTYNVKKDLVIDHRNGRRMSFKRFAKGFIKDIHS
jgi:peptide chain release factor 1